MKTIILKRMELRNFKGVVNADYDFSEHTEIIGANATGKSTLYEAYLWCLFDKNANGNATKVQPLNDANEVIHKLVTSVRLTFAIDGNPFIVERKLQEKWEKDVLKGTTSEYAINDVPISKTQYTQKLTEILPLDKWFMISSIAIIPSMDQKACRAALQSIAPAIDDLAIAANYRAVLNALNKGIKVDELAAAVKRMKQEAKTELDGIPAALDAQDRLRVDEDFTELGAKIDKANAETTRLSKEIEAAKGGVDTEYAEKLNKFNAELTDANKIIREHEQMAVDECNTARREMNSEIMRIDSEQESNHARLMAAEQTDKRLGDEIARQTEQIKNLRERWIAKNAEEYIEPEVATICPTCGQTLPEDMIEKARETARLNWNEAKTQALRKIQQEAEDIKGSLNGAQKQNEVNRAKITECAQKAERLAQDIEAARQRAKQLPTVAERLALDMEYQQAVTIKNTIELGLEEMKEAYKQNDNEERINELKGKLQATLEERDELIKRNAGRETNARIDEERNRLEARQAELADMIAEYEGEEAEIAAFRKAKITAVEDGVSSLFGIVRWKMYEANVTNDGEKEICQAIIDGVPYEQQNRAMQINAGIDICNAFAKAYEVSVPLFIDNAESVTETIPTNGQSIKMAVVAGSALQIK